MNDIVRVDKVSKHVQTGDQRVDILKSVSLTIREGEFVAIMGPSGSGKSTLLHLIGLLDRPTSGSLMVAGEDVSNLQDDRLAHLRARSIGFIFQSFHLVPYLTASQNVALPLQYSTIENPWAPAALLDRVGLTPRAHAYPATLSGGERQRVAIARALMNRPSLLLADEPTGALDTATGSQIMKLIGQLHQEGMSVLMVTHDESNARRAQRVLVMRDGRFE